MTHLRLLLRPWFIASLSVLITLAVGMAVGRSGPASADVSPPTSGAGATRSSSQGSATTTPAPRWWAGFAGRPGNEQVDVCQQLASDALVDPATVRFVQDEGLWDESLNAQARNHLANLVMRAGRMDAGLVLRLLRSAHESGNPRWQDYAMQHAGSVALVDEALARTFVQGVLPELARGSPLQGTILLQLDRIQDAHPQVAAQQLATWVETLLASPATPAASAMAAVGIAQRRQLFVPLDARLRLMQHEDSLVRGMAVHLVTDPAGRDGERLRTLAASDPHPWVRQIAQKRCASLLAAPLSAELNSPSGSM